MIRLTVTTFLLLILCSLAIAAEHPLDAVVQIWVNDQSLGAGFFVSGDGRILTAYHVIQGAHKIKVLHQGDSSSDVWVESYAPGRDLATLRIRNWKKPIPYLKLVYALPPGVADEKLQVFGHGAFIADQRIEARMTTKGLSQSEQIRGKHGERIFALNIPVIYLDANINSGMSGGPVVSSRGVIGVLSGSLSEGGSISWAIPSEYAQPQFLQPVNKRPEEIKGWPPLALMDLGWKNLRAAVAVSPELADEIDRYFLAVEKRTSNAERLPALAGDALAHVRILRGIAEKGATPDDWLVNQMKAKAEAFEKACNDLNQDGVVLTRRIVELGMKAAAFFKRYPDTQQNMALFHRFLSSLEKYRTEYKKTTEPFLNREKAMQSRIIEGLAKISGKDIGFAGRLQLLVEWEKLYSNYMGWEWNRFSIGEGQTYRKLGSEVQGLLTSHPEGRNAKWRFTSERGYTMEFPAGWELKLYPPMPRLLSEQGRKALEAYSAIYHNLGVDLEAVFTNETIISGLGGTDDITLLVGTGPVQEFTEAERMNIIVEARRYGYREVEAKREILKGKPAMILRKTLDTPNGAIVFYNTNIRGTRGILHLHFVIPATYSASVISSCQRVVEATEYK